MKTATFLVGLPCSGKTTYRERFLNCFALSTALSTDDSLLDYAKESGLTYQESFKMYYKEAEKNLYQDLQWAIDNNVSFVWDQTNLVESARQRKLAMIPNDYIKVAIVFPFISFETFKDRNEKRVNKIPDDVYWNLTNKATLPFLKEHGFDAIYNLQSSFLDKLFKESGTS